MNTIDVMQNGKYFFGYCNEIEYNHDLVLVVIIDIVVIIRVNFI